MCFFRVARIVHPVMQPEIGPWRIQAQGHFQGKFGWRISKRDPGSGALRAPIRVARIQVLNQVSVVLPGQLHRHQRP
jgi:hypothetical protein